jgi:hypothetical protein
VIVTGTIDAFNLASCNISTTGIPTPVASATTSRYRVPSGSRSTVGCIHRK